MQELGFEQTMKLMWNSVCKPSLTLNGDVQKIYHKEAYTDCIITNPFRTKSYGTIITRGWSVRRVFNQWEENLIQAIENGVAQNSWYSELHGLILTPCIVEEAVFNVGVEGGAAEESNAHCYLLLLGQVQGRRGRGVRLVLLCSLYYLLGLIYFFIHIFVQRNICCMYVHRGAPAEIKSSQLQLVLCLFSVALFWSDATDCLNEGSLTDNPFAIWMASTCTNAILCVHHIYDRFRTQ